MLNGIVVMHGGVIERCGVSRGYGPVEVWKDSIHQLTVEDVPDDPTERTIWLTEFAQKMFELGQAHKGRETKVSEYD
jgi:hypothetical protein